MSCCGVVSDLVAANPRLGHYRARRRRFYWYRVAETPSYLQESRLVEPAGIESATSCLQSRSYTRP
jgi:hypothetical protein